MTVRILSILAFVSIQLVAAPFLRSAVAQAPVLELDHAYILVPPGAVQALAALRQAGVQIDTNTFRHDGEGTTSMAAYFENGYLELMWVDSSLTVDSAHVDDVADFQRGAAWRESGASPFGVGLHFLSGALADLGIPTRLDPIPETNPQTYWVLLRQPAESLAPDLFIMPRNRAVPAWIERFRRRSPETFAHAAGMHRITRVVIHGTAAQRPRAATLDLRPIRFEESREPLLEMEFDGGRQGKRRDLRPALPVVLAW